MQAVAKLKNLRIAPRKVRLIAKLIRGKKVERAQAVLSFTIKRASSPTLKLLNQAVANAKNNFDIDSSNLYISKITVDEGPKLKRWRARSRGRAFEIQKKTSHITLILEEIKSGGKIKKKKVEKKEKPKREELALSEKQAKIEVPPIGDIEEIEKQDLKFKKPKSKEKIETPKPKNRGGIRRFFRRKSF